ncbi:MAG: tetratricopeptide repeat protein [Myxococcales bacterium]
MKSWFGFSILWMLTGSPVLAALVVLGAWAVADWYTFGFARRLVRAFMRVRRGNRLENLLRQNPHDRKARAELGEILNEQRRYGRAVEVLRPILDTDPDDLTALYLLGVACCGTGKAEQGELFLGSVLEVDPKFRSGAPLLEMGRWRLNRGDGTGAVEKLQAYVERHTSSVEGHYLLSRAFALAGDAARADAHRARAWEEYRSSLPYQQRHERLWAWRANPSRPAMYAALLVMGMLAMSWAGRHLPQPAPGYGDGAFLHAQDADPGDEP